MPRTGPSNRISRRAFSSALAATALGILTADGRRGRADPATVTPEQARPAIPYGVASGDVTTDSAIIWSRCDRPARMFVEYATTDSFRDARRVAGPAALEDSDFTAKIDLEDLPAGQHIFYRVRFQDLSDPKVYSPAAAGSFRTAPRERGDVFFAWSGDTAGQGFGINPKWGGLKIYETIRRLRPDFFIHSGDHVYADNPLAAEVRLDDGTIWENVVTPAKAKVAETLAEFRGNYAYNLLDEHFRRFNAEVPCYAQWDDHETINNWYPGKVLDDPRYAVKSCSLLAARACRAFFEYLPIRPQRDRERIYRTVRYGPLLQLFLLDQRSYRGPNSANRQPAANEATAFLGAGQLAWLKRELLASRATWKVIASDMPVGLIVPDGKEAFEGAANGDGPPLGRELEFAELFAFLKENKVRNVVWLTADVHYAAAHYYDPAKARFDRFDGFWEFVAGPLHAGTFGPNPLDDTFGPQVKFQGVPKGMKPNRPPSEGLQFFGTVRIDGKTAVMTVALYNLEGKKLYTVDLPPA